MSIRQIFSTNALRPTTGPVVGGSMTDPGAISTGQGGIGSGGGGFSLPYWVNFYDETIGQTPDGWVAGAPTPNVMPVVANNLYSGGFAPAYKVLHFNSDVTNYSCAELALPGAVDVTSGIRFCFWMSTETANPADTLFTILNKSIGSADETGFAIGPRRASPYDMEVYSIFEGAWTKYGTQRSIAQHYYTFYKCEWFPATGQLYQHCQYMNGGADYLAANTITVADTANMQSGFNQISHIYLCANANANVYYRDIYFCGFWIGSPTDAWPSYAGPPA